MDGVLKPEHRKAHAQAMTKYYDKEALAEEWHGLLSKLDPIQGSTTAYAGMRKGVSAGAAPLAPENADPQAMAYAILCMKEGMAEGKGKRKVSLPDCAFEDYLNSVSHIYDENAPYHGNIMMMTRLCAAMCKDMGMCPVAVRWHTVQ